MTPALETFANFGTERLVHNYGMTGDMILDPHILETSNWDHTIKPVKL